MNDLFEFNPSTNTWRNIIPRGSFLPRVIGCQTTAIYDDKLWSFGGYHPNEGITDDFNCFDFSTNTWSIVNCPKLPKKRSQHVSFIYNDSLIVIGGFYHDQYTEVDSFNFYTKQWNEIPCSGDIPKRTSKLGAAIHGDNIFIFGGQSDHVNNDMYVLNLPQRVWVKVQMEGTVPTPRQWHFLFVWNENLYVTCGCNGNRATTTELYKMQLPKIRKKPDKLLVALYHQSFADVIFEYNSL
jgi:N-acetylneuraminic acid mutarotase